MIKHSNWYWVREFAGDGLMWMFVINSAMILGGILTMGIVRFVESNLWMLYMELALLILFAFVAADRTIDDGIRYNQERRL